MGNRSLPAAVIAAMVIVLLAGCRGGGRTHAAATGTPARGGGATAASGTPAADFTAGRLKKAMISPPAGATNVRSAAGDLPKVLARFSPGESAGATQDDRGCSQPGTFGLGGSRPAAFLDYIWEDRSYTILLTSAREPAVKRLIGRRLPERCRSMRFTAGNTTVTAHVRVDEPLRIGDGGRIVRTDETSGGVRLRSWEALFAAQGYVASIDVAGIRVTRADAERTARQVQRKASTILR